jgi:hypothetical protein
MLIDRRTSLAVLVLCQGLAAGCGTHPQQNPFAGPSAPSPAPAPATGLAVTDLSPAVGSTGGSSQMKMVGTGFQSGATVSFDGVKVSTRFDGRDRLFTNMLLETPAHAAGTVDVTVTLPDGTQLLLPKAYRYESPDAFDFNGSWSAYSFDGSDRLLDFTLEANTLVRATCWGAGGEVVPLSIASPATVAHGEFVFTGAAGTGMSGRIVAASEAVGTINLAPCTNMAWRTYPKTVPSSLAHIFALDR